MKIIGIAVVLCLCNTIIFSQSYHPKSTQLIDTTSAVLCRCFNTTFDSLDNEVKDLLKEVLINPTDGQQKIQDYMKQAKEERIAEITQQFQQLGSIDSDLTTCFDNATHIFQHLPCGIEELSIDDQLIVMKDFESEEKTIDLLMKSLAVHEGCEFAYQFIKLGLELEKK